MLKLIILIAGLYILSLCCRSGRKELKELKGWYYAHRGLHGNGVPENSLAAFQAALDGGYGVELDVHLLKDGTLAVMHDSLLNRTTGQPGRLEDLTAGELGAYRLENTQQTIPTLDQVLELFQGKAPMIIELKSVDGNHQALAEAVCRRMDSYQGPYCMESFDPLCVAAVRKLRPNVIRGQLAENFMKSRSDMPDYMKFLMTHCMGNILSMPDFIAYCFEDRKNTPSTTICRMLWKAQGVAWTIRSQADFDTAVSEGWIPIFEGFIPARPALEGGQPRQLDAEPEE